MPKPYPRRRRRTDDLDVSTEDLEDAQRQHLPIRDADGRVTAYQRIEFPRDTFDDIRARAENLPAVDRRLPPFIPHSDWMPVFRKPNGEALRTPRAVTKARERERFAGNAQSLKVAWETDQAWVWSLILVLVLFGGIVWFYWNHFRWFSLFVVVIATSGMLVWCKKRDII
jgi:hypothetical protein